MVQIKTLPFRRIANAALALASTAVTLFCGGYAHAAVPITERAVLLDIYTSTNGAGWINSAGWNGASGTERSWYGVGCGGSGGNSVVSIVL